MIYILYIIAFFQQIQHLAEILDRIWIRYGNSVLRDLVHFGRNEGQALLFQFFADNGEGIGSGIDDVGIFIDLDIIGTGFQCDHHHLVLIGTGLTVHDQHALFVKHKAHAAGSAHVSAVLGEAVTHVTGSTVAVIGNAVHNDGHSAGSVSFIGDLLIDHIAQFTARLFNGALNVIVRHVVCFSLGNDIAQLSVGFGIGSAFTHCDGDLAADLGEYGTAGSIRLAFLSLKAYFEGKREVFEGLEIAQLGHDWVKRPVLMLDLNTNKYDAPEVLEIKLDESLRQWEEKYGCERADLPLGMRFENVIRKAAEKTGHRVAILVDEYDKPMLQAIGKPDLQQAYRNTLKGFYGALKSMDSYIKFAFLTGVTKFGKVSVFSDLNNLKDISMDVRFYDICGITQQELLTYFAPEVEALAQANGMTKEECVEKLRKEYDGYHFEETAPGMYNPFSVLNTLDRQKFGSYWFETGTPTYLVTLLQMHDYPLEEMSQVQVKADVLNSVDVASTNPIPVIYQSGYLTIKDYDPDSRPTHWAFPTRKSKKGSPNI